MLGFDATGRLALGEVPSSGGAVFIQTISATASGAVSIVKRAGKTIAASAAGSASIRKAVAFTRAATSSGTVTVIKSIGKRVLASGSGAVTVATPITRACIVLATAISNVSMVRGVGKIVRASCSGAVSYVKALAFTVNVSAIGHVTITATGLIVQAVRRALYLRGRTGSFWRGRR